MVLDNCEIINKNIIFFNDLHKRSLEKVAVSVTGTIGATPMRIPFEMISRNYVT